MQLQDTTTKLKREDYFSLLRQTGAASGTQDHHKSVERKVLRAMSR